MNRNFVIGFLLAILLALGVYWLYGGHGWYAGHMLNGNGRMHDSGMMGGGAGPGTGNAIAEVRVPALTKAEKQGEALFNTNCAVCHGVNAAGNEGAGPPLVHEIYEPSHHGDGAFVLAAKNGVRAHHWNFGNMPPVQTVNEADVAEIVVYVRALQRANGIN